VDGQTHIKMEGVEEGFLYGRSRDACFVEIHLEIKKGNTFRSPGRRAAASRVALDSGLLDSPTGGEYTLNGQPVANLSIMRTHADSEREIGFIFQAFNLMAT